MTQKIKSGKYNILVVDDDVLIRCLIDDILQKLNYNILHACNGEEAIETLETKDIDLVILDLYLPGKNGFEICTDIRAVEEWKDIPIMIMTAVYTRSQYFYKCKEFGANAFITKPFKCKTLVNQVNKLLKIEKPQ
jgi:DNA-binding response OmpR family regulator